MNAEPTIDALRGFFASHPAGIDAAYLFGSVARGQARADSDVDVGVLLSAGPPKTLSDFDRLADQQSQLTELLGREVDLVPLNGAPPDLLHRVLRDRVLLFDGDHERRIEFEIRARNEYFDLKPLIERYRRDVLRRACTRAT